MNKNSQHIVRCPVCKRENVRVIRHLNDIANLTLVRDKVNEAWVLMGAEIKTEEDETGELTKEQWKELVEKGQREYRETVRFDLTAGGMEWYTLRVTESMQVGGVG